MINNPKIHPRLQQVMAERVGSLSAAAAKTTEFRVIVKHRALPETAKAVSVVEGVGEIHRYYNRLLPGQALSATPQAIAVLAQRPDVEMIWYDAPVHIWLDASVPLIGAPIAYQAGYTGKGIRVGIVDTGIDPTHPDFAGRIVEIKDFTGEGNTDQNGHGTHVAGIIGGSGAASGGKYRGVAYECQYLIARVLKHDGSGMMSDVIAGLEYVAENKAQVVNLSLGNSGACDGTDAVSAARNAAADRGIVVCVAAGNEGPGASTVGAPGCATRVITVGATDKSDRIASFSSRGPTLDGRTKPDVLLPGVGIISCRAAGTSMGQPVNDKYTAASGTSMATPHASGVCALLLQANPNLTAQRVKQALMDTALDLGLDPNTGGSGRVQVPQALAYATSGPQPTPPPDEPPPPPTPEPVPPPAPPGGGCLTLVKAMLGGK